MPDIGRYVLVRSRDQGCVCGEYRGHIGREVTLGQARQLFRWNGDRLTLFDVAVIPGELRLSEVNEEAILLEACGIVLVAPEVEKAMRETKAG